MKNNLWQNLVQDWNLNFRSDVFFANFEAFRFFLFSSRSGKSFERKKIQDIQDLRQELGEENTTLTKKRTEKEVLVDIP